MNTSPLLQDYNKKSLLIIKTSGQLVRMYCPFPVKNDEEYFLTVTAIYAGNDGFPYYCIDGTCYIYSLFAIFLP